MEGKPVPEKLLEILACPACDSRPKVEMIGSGLRCPQCGRIYPVEDGVPIMLIEKAAGGGEHTQ